MHHIGVESIAVSYSGQFLKEATTKDKKLMQFIYNECIYAPLAISYM